MRQKIKQAMKYLGCDGKDRKAEMLQDRTDKKTWYAGHLVFYLEYLEHTVNYITVWENIYLIEAVDAETAFDLADTIGQQEEQADINGRHTANGLPVRWRYAGVRRLGECIDFDMGPESGQEVTYLSYTVKDKSAIDKLLNKQACAVVIETEADEGVHPELLSPLLDQNL